MWAPRRLHVEFWIQVDPERKLGPSQLEPGNEQRLCVCCMETVSGLKTTHDVNVFELHSYELQNSRTGRAYAPVWGN